MTFQEYRESGLFLRDINSSASQDVTPEALREYSSVPFYTNLTNTSAIPASRKVLFAVSCYYTSLLLQAPGKLYGYKYVDYCCRSTHWPYFCVGYGGEVSPIEILKQANLLPHGKDVDVFVEKLDEARDCFVEDFISMISPGAWSPDPVAHRALVEKVDFPVLRKELDNEIGFLRDWVYHQNSPYEDSYVEQVRYLFNQRNVEPFKENPSICFPSGETLGVKSFVTLHSQRFQKQLNHLTLDVKGSSFYPGYKLKPGPTHDLLRDFLGGKKVRIDYNRVFFRTVRGFFENEEKALLVLKEPVIKSKTQFRADRFSQDGRFEFSVIPESVQVKIIRGEGRLLYDVALVSFDTELQIFSPLPLIPLEQLETPYEYGGKKKTSGMTALRAVLEYGDQVKLCVTKDDTYIHSVMKVPDSIESMEKAFFYSEFGKEDLTPVRMVHILENVDAVKEPKHFISDDGSFSLEMYGHHCDWNKIIRDIDEMTTAIDKAIVLLHDPYNRKKRHLFLSNHNDLEIVFPDNAADRVELLDTLESWSSSLWNLRMIIKRDLIPLEMEMAQEATAAGKKFPYGKRKKSRVARTLCHYLFQKIQLDPLTYVDHSNEYIRGYARMLVSI